MKIDPPVFAMQAPPPPSPIIILLTTNTTVYEKGASGITCASTSSTTYLESCGNVIDNTVF